MYSFFCSPFSKSTQMCHVSNVLKKGKQRRIKMEIKLYFALMSKTQTLETGDQAEAFKMHGNKCVQFVPKIFGCTERFAPIIKLTPICSEMSSRRYRHPIIGSKRKQRLYNYKK